MISRPFLIKERILERIPFKKFVLRAKDPVLTFRIIIRKQRRALRAITHCLFYEQNHLPLPGSGTRVPPRIVIASQPKAGTYLCAAILEEIGFDFTFLHLNVNKIQAYDRNLPALGRLDPTPFDCFLPLNESRRLVRTGQVAASHLVPSRKVVKLLRDFKIVAVKRELRSAVISYMRFLIETGRVEKVKWKTKEGLAGFLRSHGRFYIERTLAINEWGKEPNAILLRFEDLLSDPSAQILLMAQFLGKDPQDIPDDVYEKARKNKTLTKSDHRIKIEWDERAETEFRRVGGIEANSILGYG